MIIFNNLSRILCFIGLVYQCYYVCLNYFGFEVINELYLSDPLKFVPLSISIMIYLPQITNFSDLISRNYQQLSIGSEIDWRDPIKINLTVEEDLMRNIGSNRWLESVYDQKKFLDVSFIRDPNLYVNDGNISEYFNLTRMLSYRGYLCYRYEYIHDIPYNFEDLFFERNLPVMQSFRMDTGIAKKNIFYIHQRKTFPRGERRHFFRQLDNNEYFISYNRKIIKKLPPPYTTNCKDYTQENYEDRLHKVEECFLRQCKMIYGGVCASIIYPIDSDLKLDYKFNGTKSEVFSEISNKISKYCLMESDQVDCYSEIIIPQILLKDSTENRTKINIYPPIDSDIIFEKNPKILFIDLLVYIASSLSLWFSFCFFNIMERLIKVAQKAFTKYFLINLSSNSKNLNILIYKKNFIENKFINQIN